MGIRMSFDKHVSSLDELLDMPVSYFQKVKFESKIDSRINQHIKVRSPTSENIVDMEFQ